MQKALNMTNIMLSFLLVLSIPFLLGLTYLPDPTQPPGAISPGKQVSEQHSQGLTGVFIYKNQKYAIIGGQRVQVGEHVGEYIVTNIKPYTVELTNLKNIKEVLQLTPQVKRETN